jgi:hypothetical protein
MANTFDLRIRFTGLCLLVPDTRAGAARLHVLLPFVDGHDHGAHGAQPSGEGEAPVGGHAGHEVPGAGGAIPAAGEGEADGAGGDGRVPGSPPAAPPVVKHLSRLIYDSAYRLDKPELSRELDCVDLHGRIVEFLGMGLDEMNPFVPSEVANLDKVVTDKARLHTFVDSDTPGPELAARVTVDRGAVTDCLFGVQARFLAAGETGDDNDDPEQEPRFTAQVEWTIRGIEGDSLTISMQKGLNEAGAGTDITLTPIGRTICVDIWNAPEHELPGAPPLEEDQPPATDHFAAFYMLVNASTRPVPKPRDLQLRVKNACVDREIQLDDAGRGIAPGTLMCMTGQVKA